MTLAAEILKLLARRSGLTDGEIAAELGRSHQTINAECNRLATQGRLERRRGIGGIRNLLSDTTRPTSPAKSAQDILNGVSDPAGIEIVDRPMRGVGEDAAKGSEDLLKRQLKDWLEKDGWKVQVAWGMKRGVDVIGTKGTERWLIEVKGIGSRPEMRVNYFIGMLGELLQRMDDPHAKYSIALPDHKQFRGLWNRLPELAKKRTQITMLFIREDGRVEHSWV